MKKYVSVIVASFVSLWFVGCSDSESTAPDDFSPPPESAPVSSTTPAYESPPPK